MAGHFDIPYITGKADDIGVELGNAAQNVIGMLIDRIFRRLHRDALPAARRIKAAQRQGGMDELGV